MIKHSKAFQKSHQESWLVLHKAEHKFLSVDRGGDLSSSNYHFEKLSLAPRLSYPDMKSPFNVWYVVF